VARRSPSCVGSTGSRTQRSTPGGANTAGWRCRRCAGSRKNRRLKSIVANQALDIRRSDTYWQKTAAARGLDADYNALRSASSRVGALGTHRPKSLNSEASPANGDGCPTVDKSRQLIKLARCQLYFKGADLLARRSRSTDSHPA
jgi:hypothetical protein